MTFETEPTGYEKTILSDLQGAWSCFFNALTTNEPFTNLERVIFHYYEATSWESVRDLNQMKKTLLVIKNVISQSNVTEDVTFWLAEVDRIFNDTIQQYQR
ncbi:hypothetical protein [Piscirickettsia litoralis]|uniref:Transposase n=1 Tax=Piscirickettsia litoralis TaxID=1891921 RepID=A0ABX3A1V6_9GAMM|nr:hypothetical protein [Piscirickettsia litoralis]ODN41425.1 hypothetical protein BGC07_16820 [Piscirickettsia litoralis]